MANFMGASFAGVSVGGTNYGAGMGQGGSSDTAQPNATGGFVLVVRN